jgi:hypothetical protein
MSLISLLFASSLFRRDAPLLMQQIIRKGHIPADEGGRHVISIIFNLSSSMVSSDILEDSDSDFSKQAANSIYAEMNRQQFFGEGIDSLFGSCILIQTQNNFSCFSCRVCFTGGYYIFFSIANAATRHAQTRRRGRSRSYISSRKIY